MRNHDHQQPVFRALADPTRRSIIDLLQVEPLPIATIAEQFDMSRPAVAKHLSILKEGGLIAVEKKGRERINHLTPGGLKTIAEWINHFDQFWDDRLAQLKKAAEETQ